MAQTPYAPVLNRNHWAGANADVDIHIEAYEGDIDGSFRVESLFRTSGFTNFKSVAHQSNTFRGDRLGAAVVSGRKSGDKPDGSRIANDKYVVTVDTTTYIRTPIDYQDDWTAPDMQSEYSAEHGSAHAKFFDQAHIIQLIKCASFVAPAHLKPAFYDGIGLTITGFAAEANPENKADLLARKHKEAIATFIKRDMGGSLSDMVTLLEVDAFNTLLDHKKLMDVSFSQSGDGSGNFAMRRVGWLNGCRVIETPRFPTSAIATHPLGAGYTVSAAEAKARAIIFNPRKALVTVEAQPMTVRAWDDPENFQTVLDSYTMYAVGQRRPDAVAVLFTD